MQLRTKIFMALFGSAALGVALLAASAFYFSRAALLDSAARNLDAIATTQKRALLKLVRASRDKVALVGSRTQLRELLRRQAAAVDPDGQSRMDVILADAKASVAELEEVMVLDLDGRVVASTAPGRRGEVHAHILQGITETREGRLLLSVSTPMRLRGKLIGSTWGLLDAGELIDQVTDYTGLGETGETVLARHDESGNAVILTPLRNQPAPPLSLVIPAARTEVPMVESLHGRERLILTGAADYAGESVIAATRFIPEVAWGLVTKVDRREVYRPIDEILAALVASGLVLTLALGLWSSMLARRLIEPVSRLAAVAGRIGDGDWEARARIEGNDELARLGGTMNHMAEQLSTTAEQLQADADSRARVEERSDASRRLRLALEAAPAAVLMVAADGSLVLASRAAEQLFGFSRAELLRMSFAQLVPGLWRDTVAGTVQPDRTGQLNTAREICAHAKDGREVPVEIRLNAVDTAEGRMTLVAAVDVSLRKRAESEIALLRRIAVAANEARHEDEVLTVCLRQVCRLTGWPLGHVVDVDSGGRLRSRKLWSLADGDAPGVALFRRVSEESEFEAGEGLPGRALLSGTAQWVSDLAAVDGDPRARTAGTGVRAGFAVPVLAYGEVVAVLEFFHHTPVARDEALLALMRDVGHQVGRVFERQRAEAELRDARNTLHSAIETMSDAFALYDADDRLVLCNQRYVQLHPSCSSRLVPGVAYTEFLAAALEAGDFARTDGSDAHWLERQLAARRERRPRELALAGGSWLRISERAMADGGLVEIRSDITELKRREFALERSNDELRQFAYVASHDLQEPLRKIHTFAHRVNDSYARDLDERGRDYLDRLCRATRRMSSLISDLLEFSRVTRQTRPFEQVNLDEALAEALSDLDLLIQESDARIECDGLPPVEGDARQLQQLLLNLVGNAVKYQRPGQTPRVRVSAEQVGAMLRLEVSDNGIGFEPQYAEQIFEVFKRLHPRERFEGTGIGLAIVRRIVEHHGGRISAAARPGEGAVFTVLLPLCHDEGEAIAA